MYDEGAISSSGLTAIARRARYDALRRRWPRRTTTASHGASIRCRSAINSGTSAKISPEQAPEVDARTTAAFLRYYTHLLGGRLDPRALQSLWTLKPERPDLVDALTTAVKRTTSRPRWSACSLNNPSIVNFRKRWCATARSRQKEAGLRFPPTRGSSRISSRLWCRRCATDSRSRATSIRRTKQIQARSSTRDTIAAVKRFEERHRIKPDGIVDAATVTALNVSVEQRIRTIELNLERWRWLPDPMPARHFIVNVPDFHLEAIEDGNPVLEMRVVVGEPDNKTPIFADSMTHVVFSPYWNVPAGIAKDETIPRAASDPGFLDRNNMEVGQGVGRGRRSVFSRLVEPGRSSHPSAAGQRQRAGRCEVHFPEQFRRLSSRYECDHAVRPYRARV